MSFKNKHLKPYIIFLLYHLMNTSKKRAALGFHSSLYLQLSQCTHFEQEEVNDERNTVFKRTFYKINFPNVCIAHLHKIVKHSSC